MATAKALNVLICEDEPELREALRESFERDGHRAVAVSNGRDAIEQAGAEQFDVMLLDVGLGAGSPDGYEVCRELRRQRNVIAIVMLTARQSEADAVLGLEAGADDYIVKPFRPAELMSRIRAILRRSNPPDAEGGVITLGAVELDLAQREMRVGGVPAYSTLGWFDDPLLNTFMAFADAEVARLVFHELSHQLLYVKGDTAFNESFAVAVEEEGVRRWLEWRADSADRNRYAQFAERRGQFLELIGRYRERLQGYYRDTASFTPLRVDERRNGKAALFAELDRDYERLKLSWGGFGGYDRIMGKVPVTTMVTTAVTTTVTPVAAPNNALLAAIVTYSEWLPAFRHLLAKHNGDLDALYGEARRLAAMDRPARERAVRDLL